MSGFNTKECNNNGEYEITFYSDNRDDFKTVENLCRSLIGHNKPNAEGDCISREALRKQMKELLDLSVKRVNDTPNTSPCYRMYVAQENERARLIDLIDNAQAIPLPNEQTAWEQGYEAGLAQGKQDRPQGEWIKIDEEWYDYKCSVCGEKVRRLYPFCHCGADMLKGDAEE